MSDRPVAAVVGVGSMGRRHLQALQREGIAVGAVADIDEANLSEAARVSPGARLYRDWESMLSADSPDLLCVATTSPAHAPIVIKAAQAGIRTILCEKPLATGIADGRAMVAACRAAGTRLVINHSRRLFPPYVRIREALATDVFGDLRFMRVTCGASGLANIGSHAFDLMRWFCGEAEAVVGYVDPIVLASARGSGFRDQTGHGLIEFAGARRATFDFTGDFPAGFVVEFGCRLGRIIVREQTRTVEAMARTAEARRAPLGDYFAAVAQVPLAFNEPVDIVAMTAAMIRNALSSEPPACGGEDALSVLEMIAAVHVSAQDGHRRVALPLHDDRGTLAAIA